MEIGFQAYSMRRYFARDPGGALAAVSNAKFVELAGPAERTYLEISQILKHYSAKHSMRSPLPPILGAHLCPVNGLPDSDVAELAQAHLEAFPGIRWFTFCVNPHDIPRICESSDSRRSVYQEYREKLLQYKQMISGLKKADVDILYHLYCHDFLKLPSDYCAFHELIVDGERKLQIDTFFSAMVGVCPIDFLDAYGAYTHSIHSNSWDDRFRQSTLPKGIIPDTSWQALLTAAAANSVEYLIVEHDIDVNGAELLSESVAHLMNLKSGLGL